MPCKRFNAKPERASIRHSASNELNSREVKQLRSRKAKQLSFACHCERPPKNYDTPRQSGKINTKPKNSPARLPKNSSANPPIRSAAFSLVEMLMALLVASLLLAALAPVLTKKINENMHITGDVNLQGEYITEEIEFGSKYCSNLIHEDNDPTKPILYCEGEYPISEGITSITVTAIGAGGGGASAPTAGYMEYTDPNATNNAFMVPTMVNEIETTLIGGAPGGNPPADFRDYRIFKNPGTPMPKYDGEHTAPSDKVIETDSNGSYTWAPSDFSLFKGQKMIVTACGGGGGGGGVSRNYCKDVCTASGGGGAGYYQTESQFTPVASWTSIKVEIGGGGGGGASSSSSSTYNIGYNGGARAGGGGGASKGGVDSGRGGGGGKQGGAGGTSPQGGWGSGGQAGSATETGVSNGNDYYQTCFGSWSSCPDLTGPPNGGNVNITAYMPTTTVYAFYGGAGGGGSLVDGYGGGGGGGGVLSGGGGGGGGGTRIVNIGWLWPGGGGGGGGCEIRGDATSNYSMSAGGGGGGGGTFNSYGSTYMSGGNGAICNFISGKYVAGGGGRGLALSASGINPGMVSEDKNIFGSDFCNGGGGIAAGGVGTTAHGESGKPGAMKFEYVSSTSGGYGGSAAKYIERRKLNVNAGQEFILTIGKGTKGGTGAKLTYEDGAIEYTGVRGANFGDSTIIRNKSTNEIIIETGRNVANTEGGGAPNGFEGGNGGTVTTAFTGCTPAQGGKVLGEKAENGKGYGCGGGGAHSLSDAGDGGSGYARISWNMYWKAALNEGKGAYDYSELDPPGGGASGNVITETIRVSSPQIIKIRIGAGGKGAKIENNTYIPSTNGGTTIFGDENFIQIKAGGGGGGGITEEDIKKGNITVLANSRKGEPSQICNVGATNYVKNKNRCTQGSSPANTDDKTKGNPGKDFSLSIHGKTYRGESGASGTRSNNTTTSSGKTPKEGSIASGGGGAALLIHNKVSNSVNLDYPTGGDGAPGRIILKLWK